MKSIAIIVVTYNRLNSLRRLLLSLESADYNQESPTLIISIDKSNTDIIEKFADSYNWPHGFLIVDKHDKNLGLKEHMLSLGKWFDQFEAIVVLEDDIVVSPGFYSYTRESVERYYDNSRIAGISLYNFEVNYQTGTPFQPINNGQDVFFMNCAMSWGEVWMKDSWTKFYKWYNVNKDFSPSDSLPQRIFEFGPKSWLKYHTRYCIEQDLLFVYPYVSLSTNCSDAGTHNIDCNRTQYQTNILRGKIDSYRFPDTFKDAIIYDGFFENSLIYKSIGLSKDVLCIDLYSKNLNKQGKRYWLTSRVENYRIVKSYGINYRPIEINVLVDNPGNDIFIYDTSIYENNRNVDRQRSFLFLYHVDSMLFHVRDYGFVRIIKDFIIEVFKKFF